MNPPIHADYATHPERQVVPDERSGMNPPVRAQYVVFLSFEQLRDAHGALLVREHTIGATPQLLDKIERFIEVVHATGVLLDNIAERRAAQSILDYWAATLLRARHTPPYALLADFDIRLAPTLPDDTCPYLGLNAFHERDSERFFGRQRLIAQLLDKLNTTPLLAVVGASGSGKSSTVLAGLIPNLKDGALPGSKHWHYYPTIVPGSQPLRSLLQALRPKSFDAVLWHDMHTTGLRRRPEYLVELIRTLDTKPIVLVIDQFEEVFTLCYDIVARDMFVANLLNLIAETTTPHKVILTMRNDFLDKVAKIEELQRRFEDAKIDIPPMDAGELREAIERPARAVGLKFEEGVVNKLIGDILGERSGLPLLQHAMLALWDRKTKNRVLLSAYNELGNVRDALSLNADSFYNRLPTQDKSIAKRILLQLVEPDEGFEITSRRQSLAELYQIGERRQQIDAVLERLQRARLVRITVGDGPEDTQVEVAHEALVQNWKQLRDWVAAEREVLRRRRRVEAAAAEWQRLDQSPDGLLRGVVLAEALQLQDLGPQAREFIEASKEAEEREAREKEDARQRRMRVLTEYAAAKRQSAEAERQRAEEAARREVAERKRAEEQTLARKRLQQVLRWLVLALVGTGIVLIFAFVAAWFALDGRQRAQSAAATSQAESLRAASAEAQARTAEAAANSLADLRSTSAAAAQNVIAVKSTAAMQAHIDKSTAQAALALQQTAEANAQAAAGEARTAEAAARAAEATARADAAARSIAEAEALSAADAAREAARVQQLTAQPLLVAETTRQVASARTSEALAQQDVQQVRALVCQARSAEPRLALALAIMAAERDRGVIVENTLQHAIQRVRRLVLHSNLITSASWNQDGQYILTSGADGTAKVWRADNQALVMTLVGHTGAMTSAAWSSGGSAIVTSGVDGRVLIYDASIPLLPENRRPQLTIDEAHQGTVTGVSWSPDDRIVVSVGDDRRVRGWDATQRTMMFERETRNVELLTRSAFSPDGRQFVTASADGVVRIRSSTTGEDLASLRHAQPVNSAAWSPDGTTILTAAQDGTVRIWNIGNRLVRDFFTPTAGAQLPSANQAMWSPTGRSIVTAWNDNNARVWALAEPENTYILDGSDAALTSAAWSPNSRQIVTGAANGEMRVYYVFFDDILDEARDLSPQPLTPQEELEALEGGLVQYQRTAECP